MLAKVTHKSHHDPAPTYQFSLYYLEQYEAAGVVRGLQLLRFLHVWEREKVGISVMTCQACRVSEGDSPVQSPQQIFLRT